VYEVGGVGFSVHRDFKYLDMKLSGNMPGCRQKWLYVLNKDSREKCGLAEFDVEPSMPDFEKEADAPLVNRMMELQSVPGRKLWSHYSYLPRPSCPAASVEARFMWEYTRASDPTRFTNV
jgi:hypothetical protein